MALSYHLSSYWREYWGTGFVGYKDCMLSGLSMAGGLSQHSLGDRCMGRIFMTFLARPELDPVPSRLWKGSMFYIGMRLGGRMLYLNVVHWLL